MWLQDTLRGSSTLFKVVCYLALRLGRPVGRVLMYLIVVYFFLFSPTHRRHSLDYLRRVLGRKPSWLDRFRQDFCFGSVILDRLYLASGRYELFDVSIQGAQLMQGALERGAGAFLMGSHMGSFEVVSAVGRARPGLTVSWAMYEEYARKLHEIFLAVNPTARLNIIPLGSAEAMLHLKECLEQGQFVGMLADRPHGEQPAHAVSFLGAQALLPTGPMRLAAVLRQPVFFMVGLYRGANRYHVQFEQIADFSGVPNGGREAAVRVALERYAALLERCCRSDPYNWFNFYDFWRGANDTPRAA